MKPTHCPICNEKLAKNFSPLLSCHFLLEGGPLEGLSHFYSYSPNFYVARTEEIELDLTPSHTAVAVVNKNGYYSSLIRFDPILLNEIPRTFSRVKKLLIFS